MINSIQVSYPPCQCHVQKSVANALWVIAIGWEENKFAIDFDLPAYLVHACQTVLSNACCAAVVFCRLMNIDKIKPPFFRQRFEMHPWMKTCKIMWLGLRSKRLSSFSWHSLYLFADILMSTVPYLVWFTLWPLVYSSKYFFKCSFQICYSLPEHAEDAPI